jgi:hypothetical protein
MKSVVVEDLPEMAEMYAHLPQFDETVEKAFSSNPGRQLSTSQGVSIFCLQWIWFKWLGNVSSESFHERIHRFVESGWRTEQRLLETPATRMPPRVPGVGCSKAGYRGISSRLVSRQPRFTRLQGR